MAVSDLADILFRVAEEHDAPAIVDLFRST